MFLDNQEEMHVVFDGRFTAPSPYAHYIVDVLSKYPNLQIMVFDLSVKWVVETYQFDPWKEHYESGRLFSAARGDSDWEDVVHYTPGQYLLYIRQPGWLEFGKPPPNIFNSYGHVMIYTNLMFCSYRRTVKGLKCNTCHTLFSDCRTVGMLGYSEVNKFDITERNRAIEVHLKVS